MASGGKRAGAGRKPGSRPDPGKMLVKAADRLVAELAIAITGDIKALGKDRLTELDNVAMQLMKLFAPKRYGEGNAYWSEGDEVRGAAIGGGFRGAAIGGGFRGAAIGGGFRRAAIGGGFRRAAIGGGFRGPAF